jgi:hypothetical protein
MHAWLGWLACCDESPYKEQPPTQLWRVPAQMWRVPAQMWRVPAQMWRAPAGADALRALAPPAASRSARPPGLAEPPVWVCSRARVCCACACVLRVRARAGVCVWLCASGSVCVSACMRACRRARVRECVSARAPARHAPTWAARTAQRRRRPLRPASAKSPHRPLPVATARAFVCLPRAPTCGSSAARLSGAADASSAIAVAVVAAVTRASLCARGRAKAAPPKGALSRARGAEVAHGVQCPG